MYVCTGTRAWRALTCIGNNNKNNNNNNDNNYYCIILEYNTHYTEP